MQFLKLLLPAETLFALWVRVLLALQNSVLVRAQRWQLEWGAGRCRVETERQVIVFPRVQLALFADFQSMVGAKEAVVEFDGPGRAKRRHVELVRLNKRAES